MNEMNTYGTKFALVLATMVLVSAVSGCFGTPVKTPSINQTRSLDIKGKEEWIILFEEYPLYRGVDFYKNSGYGETKVTFEYMFNSGKGTILQTKKDIDWADKSKMDYYVSGIRLLLKKESGDVYDTGMIIFEKDSRSSSFSLPQEKYLEFSVEEVQISPVHLPKSTTS